MRFKRFDIVVKGEGMKHPEHKLGVQAANEAQLRSLFAMTGEEIIEITRVYDDGEIIRDNNTNPEYSYKPTEIPKEYTAGLNSTSNMPSSDVQPIVEQSPNTTNDIPKAPPKQIQSLPKFYTIGNFEIKEQGGKIYQKKWMALDVNDIENYRIVSDTTNKIINLKGKHIEVKKWVLVDNTEEDDKLELING